MMRQKKENIINGRKRNRKRGAICARGTSVIAPFGMENAYQNSSVFSEHHVLPLQFQQHRNVLIIENKNKIFCI